MMITLKLFFCLSAILVSLVTVEAQSYGPESIKGIRVVEHIPAGLVAPSAPPPTVQAQQKALFTSPSSVGSSNTPVKIAPALLNSTPKQLLPATRRPVITTPAPISTAGLRHILGLY